MFISNQFNIGDAVEVAEFNEPCKGKAYDKIKEVVDGKEVEKTVVREYTTKKTTLKTLLGPQIGVITEGHGLNVQAMALDSMADGKHYCMSNKSYTVIHEKREVETVEYV
jgi:hypothetical protein